MSQAAKAAFACELMPATKVVASFDLLGVTFSQRGRTCTGFPQGVTGAHSGTWDLIGNRWPKCTVKGVRGGLKDELQDRLDSGGSDLRVGREFSGNGPRTP